MTRQKINVKNSWSLHLIDHMEDILETPQCVAATEPGGVSWV